MKAETTTHLPITSLRNLWKEAFGDRDEFLDIFFTTAFRPERCRYIATDEKAVAALYWFDCACQSKHVAYIYAVATAKAHRGQGLCHGLMEDAHRHLEKQGFEGALLVPGSKELFKLYEGMGYAVCSDISEIYCEDTAEGIECKRIGKAEYALLRRQLLPQGGVVQENENLDLLQTQAAFYAGQDFLLAAREQNGMLYGIELLGNTHAAPKILHTLGFSKGKFRTIGNDIPFAMYRPLGNSKLPPPTYFGLAFD